jgi:hypothetical protein
MKISTKVMDRILFSVVMLFLLAPLTVFAANKVVVIPLFGPDCAAAPVCKTLKNVVTVAKANGNFTDPVMAVNSITDASATNPYLVVIGPGVYTISQTLVMKPYVDIAGSGENVTKITGAISTGSSAIISGASHSTLSSLTVEHTGGGSDARALYNDSASPMVTNVTATASGGTSNCGVYNYNSSSPTMTGVTATASGGTKSYGVRNVEYSSPTMTGVTATASGGTEGSYGISSFMYSSPKIRRASMDGGTYGLYTGTLCGSMVSQSTIIGGAYGANSNNCVACDNGTGKALDGNCVVIP